MGHALWRVRRRLQGQPRRDPPGMLWDFIRMNFSPLGFATKFTKTASWGK